MARIGITNYFINTVITAFQAPEWTTLLTRLVFELPIEAKIPMSFSISIGEAPMLHLLTETSIFLSLPNGCLCQLAGEPIIYLTPKLQDTSNPRLKAPTNGNQKATRKRLRREVPNDTEERPNKRRKLDASEVKAKNAHGKQYVNTLFLASN